MNKQKFIGKQRVRRRQHVRNKLRGDAATPRMSVVRSHKNYMAHDENNECAIGDTVRIIEARPMSRRKRWLVLEILDRASQ